MSAQGGEALHPHLLKVTVRHRVTDERHLEPRRRGGFRPTRRVVWLFPATRATAQTATTGLVLLIIVSWGPSSRKPAPAARAIDALCITSG